MPAAPSPAWAGLTLDRTRIMGVLNVTPDSFSDGGRYASAEAAIEAGLRMAEQGADIVDVGGESARPGAPPVSQHDEQARVIPVVRALARAGLCVSIDSRNAATMRAALDEGARIVNDITALSHDPDAPALVAARGCPVVLMHIRGTPATMNSHATYNNVPEEVAAELSARLGAARQAGIAREVIALDPGIGFAKLAPHSVAMLRGLGDLARLGCPLVVGVSRKSFIGHLSGEPDPAARFPGSIAAGLFSVQNGASILRVHDVRETAQALAVWNTLSR